MGPKRPTIEKYYEALIKIVSVLEDTPRFLNVKAISQQFNIGTRFLPVAVKLNIIKVRRKGRKLIYYPEIEKCYLQPLHARDIIETINLEVKNYTSDQTGKNSLSKKEIRALQKRGYIFKKVKQ
ncbi:MAG: hypothetical protein PF569_01895 [Candidatus Woesearchaeota archaeon]|jgi:hypothetical protein|nr:hypothetical protein [Candidatus Woesearchaeota archaeon]